MARIGFLSLTPASAALAACLTAMTAGIAVLPAAAARPAEDTTAHGQGWRYWRHGSAADVQPATTPGIMFEGGGTDVNEAYRWMCRKAGNGDFLVLRESGTPAYNPYIARLCPGLNSVATLLTSSRKASFDPFVLQTIAHAEAIFLAGGDQSKYVKFWQRTPVQDAISQAAARGVPVGGTSAGNAILAQFAFSALNNSISSHEALANCFNRRITLDDGFLSLSPLLAGAITDDHFVTRHRMGRLVTFLARIVQSGAAAPAFGIALDENTAFLMEPDGHGAVVGSSTAYFLRTPGLPQTCAAGAPLAFADVPVYRAGAGATFDLPSWTGAGGTAYTVSAAAGSLTSTQKGGRVY